MSRWMLCALALAACSDDVSTSGGSVVWGDRTVTAEESWDVARLVLRAGSTITAHGVYLRVRAEELVIEGPVTIDARGAAGRPLDSPVWRSNTEPERCQSAHNEWADAARGLRDVPELMSERGRIGRDGGNVTLIARRVIGAVSDLHVDVRGGAGGPGRILECGCPDHMNERVQGAAGAPGADGRWTFVQE